MDDQSQLSDADSDHPDAVAAFVVTGGAGFIGSHVVDCFLAHGREVIVLDDLSSGRLANLGQAQDRIRFLRADVERFDFTQLPRPAAIVHLAAQASVPLSIEQFAASSMANLRGALNVLEYCRRNTVPLVYASSSAVYGDLLLGDDGCPGVAVQSPYAVDKYAMELYARVAHELYGLSSLGLRFFNVYGPRQDPTNPYSGVISIFAGNLFSGRPLRIFGGHQTRDFVYVRDAAEAVYRAVGVVSQQPTCDTVNVLSGTSISIEALAQLMSETMGRSLKRTYLPLPPRDAERSAGTVAKMSRVLGILPGALTQLRAGLDETINSIAATPPA